MKTKYQEETHVKCIQVTFLDNSSDINPARGWKATAVFARMRNSSPDRHFLTNTISSEIKTLPPCSNSHEKVLTDKCKTNPFFRQFIFPLKFSTSKLEHFKYT